MLFVTLLIVGKRCILEQKSLLETIVNY